MDEQATTEAPPAPDVSPMPAAMYWPLWVGVFAVVTWGFMHVFGAHRGDPK